MRNYYYLAISLPDLELINKPLIRFEELVDQFETNLEKNDLKAVNCIRLYFDIVNLEKILLDEPLDHRGNLDFLGISEALKYQVHFPSFVFEFFDKYKTKEEQLPQFPGLYAKYFEDYFEKTSVISEFIIFEHELRLFLLGYRSIRFQRNLQEEFKYEELNAGNVELIISQKAETKVLDEQKLQNLIEKLKPSKDPLEIRSLVASFRFEYYKEQQDLNPFTIKGLIAYMMQLLILEDLEVKQPHLGLEIFNELLEE